IKKDTSHLVFITLGILLIVIIALKAKKGKGTPLEGGMPSGHSALAFSIATMIAYFTEDIIITTLVVMLSLLVVQSRLQNGTHDFLEVLAGALIGILITLLIILLI
ncbi:MAG: phosphatase PAP2 family protein, partial [Halanaerobiaceae bacterium]